MKKIKNNYILFSQLDRYRIDYVPFQVLQEPTTSLAIEGIKRARQHGCDAVIAIGGGSVLDTGKVIAALITNRGDLMDYLEVIGSEQKITQKSAPYIAIPTTAGTGAEVTQNAVLLAPEYRVKVSMRSPLMLPALAVVDPELTYSVPPPITASTGLDALTQLMEAFVSQNANPLTDGICREGITRAARSLERAYQDGNDREARIDMCIASLFGGLALANAKLGAVHGLAGPLGGMLLAPHGVLCGRLLPFVMEANIRALRTQFPESPYLTRYQEIAKILIGNQTVPAEDGVEWVSGLCTTLKIPPLSESGLKLRDFPTVVQKSLQASSMKGNPVQLSRDELIEILRKAI